MTLGELVLRVEGSELAYAANLRTVEREEERSPISAAHTRMQVEILRFRPDESTMPGISRLEVFADKEWGTGLTPQSVRRMRGIVCTRAGLTLEEANALALNEAADILAGQPVAATGRSCGNPRDRVLAYLADVRGVEDGWVARAGGLNTVVIGTSPWDAYGPRLDEIKRRHGFDPNHPLVRSITAYLTEREGIQAEQDAERRQIGWPLPDSHPDFQSGCRQEMLFGFRLDNCRARHFPRLDASGTDIRTAADLWADLQWRLLSVRLMLPEAPRERPTVCPADVEQVYGTMRRLNLPGTPVPPYHSFTPAEAEDELRRIAAELERADRTQYDLAMAQEEANASRDTEMPPTLADLIAFHRAWKDDPKAGGSGRLELPLATSGRPLKVVHVHADILAPVARALQNADIRYQIEDMASQRGFCELGDFTSRTAEGVKSRLIGSRGISAAEADATPLTDVLEFLRQLQAASPPEIPESNRWLTVTEAAAVAGVERWVISRAADDGQLITNGKKKTERRIDKIGLVDWLLKRSKEPQTQETDAQVRAAMRRAEDD
jgi:hypothetical protein